MASWMVHLRIADCLLDRLSETGKIDDTAFVVGNIAPDSGVPNSCSTSRMIPVNKYTPAPQRILLRGGEFFTA